MLGPTTSSGAGMGRTRFEARIEEGFITAVDIDRGTCTVFTETGRELRNVRPPLGVSSAGGGQRATPMVNSACLVCYFMPDPSRRSYLISVFEMRAHDDSGGEWGGPGEWRMAFDGGGAVTFSQDGLIDLQSEPGCRLVLIPGHREARLWADQLDMLFSPLSTLRVRQDADAGASFFELFLNSRYLSRRGDTAPDVGFTLGDQVRSQTTGPFNPQSPFLAHLFTESRQDTDGSVVTHRAEQSMGHVSGVAWYARTEAVEEGVALTDQRGLFDAGGQQVARQVALSRGDEIVFEETLRADGTYWLGLGEHEPMVKGETLQGLLEETLDAILAIVLPTTTGITTGPPVNAAAFQSIRGRLETLKSTLNHVS